jgi:AbrB family looped-hinge helix DNA binding protein
MTIKVNITPTGRMNLPADIRKRLGLSDVGAVFIEETTDGIVLRTAAQAVSRAQAIAKEFSADKPDASVDAIRRHQTTRSPTHGLGGGLHLSRASSGKKNRGSFRR